MRKVSISLYIGAAIVLAILGAWIGAYIYKIKTLPPIEMPILEGKLEERLEEELSIAVSHNMNNQKLNQKLEEKREEYYKVRSLNGYIRVFKINKDGSEELYKKTNLAIEYLTDMDKRMLEDGIRVLGVEGVNSILEDYV